MIYDNFFKTYKRTNLPIFQLSPVWRTLSISFSDVLYKDFSGVKGIPYYDHFSDVPTHHWELDRKVWKLFYFFFPLSIVVITWSAFDDSENSRIPEIRHSSGGRRRSKEACGLRVYESGIFGLCCKMVCSFISFWVCPLPILLINKNF